MQASDLLDNRQLHIDADMVVLAAAIEPDKSARPLATMLTASMDTNDFFTEAHPKLRPVESPTAGVFLSGMCQGPKDIPETVAQASAAAAKVIGLLCKDSLTCNPCVAQPDEMMCNGCSNCEKVCPYGAITYIDKEFRGPNRTTLVRRVAQVNPAVCQGCGACTVACMSGAMDLKGLLQPANHCGGGCDMQVNGSWTPTIVAFCCNWCSLRGRRSFRHEPAELPGQCEDHPHSVLLPVKPDVYSPRVPARADGVILCGCHPGDCHYTTGNYYARRRMTLLFSMLDFLGIERERTRVEWVSAAEGAKFAKTMNEFAETITKLGENRRLEDLRCKE